MGDTLGDLPAYPVSGAHGAVNLGEEWTWVEERFSWR